VEPGDSGYPGGTGLPSPPVSQELGGSSETRRLKEPCMLEVELSGPPRQNIHWQDPTKDQNHPRYAQNHLHRTNGQRTRRLKVHPLHARHCARQKKSRYVVVVIYSTQTLTAGGIKGKSVHLVMKKMRAGFPRPGIASKGSTWLREA
jgi:hypothetical protein